MNLKNPKLETGPKEPFSEKVNNPERRKTTRLTENYAPDKMTTVEKVRIQDLSKQGGSYSEVHKEVKESGVPNVEVHHMPADSVSKLERNDGPAIAMEAGDHRQTASYGSSREARDYRNKQKELIEKGDLKGAIEMDIKDIKDKFGDKYDAGISQMREYVDKLELEGKIS